MTPAINLASGDNALKTMKMCAFVPPTPRASAALLPPLRASIHPHRPHPHRARPTFFVVVARFVHCADVSNACKPWDLYRRWTDCVMLEFNRQSEQEIEHGVNILEGMSFKRYVISRRP